MVIKPTFGSVDEQPQLMSTRLIGYYLTFRLFWLCTQAVVIFLRLRVGKKSLVIQAMWLSTLKAAAGQYGSFIPEAFLSQIQQAGATARFKCCAEN